MPKLQFPAAMIAGEFMDEDDWRSASSFLKVQPYAVISGSKSHGQLRFQSLKRRSLSMDPGDQGAALYTSVGHAGASAYIALMAVFGLAPAVMRPTALALNILVASCPRPARSAFFSAGSVFQIRRRRTSDRIERRLWMMYRASRRKDRQSGEANATGFPR